ncbi:adenylate/guanylate cyclase domain-containing protein [Rhizobium sp. P38BS-XIX]|uniref:adenylate/guanylate cyclase domain-containing protein n=1 Tax=Rhizobium sp. P38BS-XIX TaxID=2726740 RepID=UPI001457775C|nr:adenylate/guanylate cyclase domain-containing protein [Rhizobium sp. P38BS-XIX]NLR97421.1 adenylate/guanylate cyclase domain-containing protein [Rhizobium sp. P38BS-XIX]
MASDFQKYMVRSLGHVGADLRDSEDIAMQKVLMVGVSLVCLVAATLWGLVYVTAGAWMAGAMPLLYASLSLASNVLFNLTRRFAFYRFTQLALILVLPWAMMIVLGGFHNSSVVVLWSARWLPAFLALVVLGAIFQPPIHVVTLPPSMIVFFYVMNIGGVLSIIFGMLFYFVGKKNLFQERSEMLLLNILPKVIADALKGERRSIAQQYEEVSILFADVVQFTPMANTMAPMELVGMLDEVFMCFDLLVEKYTLEKIKTIGDCYMVASGVPSPRADHAHALARMALEMRICIRDREFKGRRLAFRIGMNSGPVVAGIIGRKKFIYDLWGDAVNTASRMEAHGEGGAIQITRATYEVIKDDFVCEARGTIDIKGKGAMEVWYVARERDRVSGLIPWSD